MLSCKPLRAQALSATTGFHDCLLCRLSACCGAHLACSGPLINRSLSRLSRVQVVSVLSRKPDVLKLIGVSPAACNTFTVLPALERAAAPASAEFLSVVADLQTVEEAVATALVRGRHPLLSNKQKGQMPPKQQARAHLVEPRRGEGPLTHNRSRTPAATANMSTGAAGASPSLEMHVGPSGALGQTDLSDTQRTRGSTRTHLGSTRLAMNEQTDSSLGFGVSGTLVTTRGMTGDHLTGTFTGNTTGTATGPDVTGGLPEGVPSDPHLSYSQLPGVARVGEAAGGYGRVGSAGAIAGGPLQRAAAATNRSPLGQVQQARLPSRRHASDGALGALSASAAAPAARQTADGEFSAPHDGANGNALGFDGRGSAQGFEGDGGMPVAESRGKHARGSLGHIPGAHLVCVVCQSILHTGCQLLLCTSQRQMRCWRHQASAVSAACLQWRSGDCRSSCALFDH